MRAARVWTALALLLCVCSVRCEVPEGSSAAGSSSWLQISRSSASRGGSKSYFSAETEPSSSSSPPPRGLLWPTTSPSPSRESYYSYSEDSREAASSKAKVRPYKAHYTIKFKPPKHREDDDDDSDDDDDDWVFGLQPLTAASLTAASLTVDVGIRTFVRAMAADDMAGEPHLVAKVIILGDSRELVDGAVDVAAVDLPVNISASVAAFRLQTRVTSPRVLSGRVLVQVLLNTKAFQLQRVSASGDSVVVVEESALSSAGSIFADSQTLELLARNRSQLLVKMPGGHTTSLMLQAQDNASLVVQSSSSLSAYDLQLRQRDQATVALVTQRLSSATVGESMESSASQAGGALCVHSVDAASITVLEANVSADGGLLQWATSSDSSSSCSVATINASGDGTSIDVGSLESGFAKVVVQGKGSLAVVNSGSVFASAVGASARVANVARPSAKDARVTDTRCSLESLVAQFPLPLERAASVVLANGQSWGVVSADPAVSSPDAASKPGPQPIGHQPAILQPDYQKPSYQQPAYQQPTYFQPLYQQEESEQPDSQQENQPNNRHDSQQLTQPEVEEEEREAATERAEEEAEREAQKRSEQEHPSTAASKPDAQLTPQPDPQPNPQTSVGSSAPADTPTSFVNGSLHMLGSIPYVDAIVVFLVSAWILHHLLQCYDRRQRRRRYTPLADAADPADRVWI